MHFSKKFSRWDLNISQYQYFSLNDNTCTMHVYAQTFECLINNLRIMYNVSKKKKKKEVINWFDPSLHVSMDEFIQSIGVFVLLVNSKEDPVLCVHTNRGDESKMRSLVKSFPVMRLLSNMLFSLKKIRILSWFEKTLFWKWHKAFDKIK